LRIQYLIAHISQLESTNVFVAVVVVLDAAAVVVFVILDANAVVVVNFSAVVFVVVDAAAVVVYKENDNFFQKKSFTSDFIFN
jgi:hypothetical protein